MKDRIKDQQPWDENLPGNKAYIQKFFKKSEKEIKEMTNEGNVQAKIKKR